MGFSRYFYYLLVWSNTSNEAYWALRDWLGLDFIYVFKFQFCIYFQKDNYITQSSPDMCICTVKSKLISWAIIFRLQGDLSETTSLIFWLWSVRNRRSWREFPWLFKPSAVGDKRFISTKCKVVAGGVLYRWRKSVPSFILGFEFYCASLLSPCYFIYLLNLQKNQWIRELVVVRIN